MGNLFSKRVVGSDTVPRNVTTLSVSWLNTEFKAVAVHRGRVEAAWARPGVSDGPGNFESFVREAVQATGFHGHSVSLVLAHPRLVQQLVDAPPVKGVPLAKVIQRYALQQKVFPGEAAWASQASPYPKGLQHVVLHLFPKLVISQIAQGCRRCGMHLTSVLPTSAVLHHQLTQLPLEKDEIALLAAETGGSTTLVIGRRDGQFLLARTLPGTWNEDPERLALDLNRTISYANQQFGTEPVGSVWLFGPGAQEQSKSIEDRIHFPARVSPVPYTPDYWAVESLKLRPEFSPNFISPQLQKAPQRRGFAKVIAACTILVTLGCLWASYYSFSEARREQQMVTKLTSSVDKLQAKATLMESLDNELSRKKQSIRLILGDRPPPTPAWVLAYLSEAVPPELVVTNFTIKREEDYYRMQIAGTFQLVSRQPVGLSPADALAQFKSRLTQGPFHVSLVETNEVTEAGAGGNPAVKPGGPNWLSRVVETLAAEPLRPKQVQEDRFKIEGLLR